MDREVETHVQIMESRWQKHDPEYELGIWFYCPLAEDGIGAEMHRLGKTMKSD